LLLAKSPFFLGRTRSQKIRTNPSVKASLPASKFVSKTTMPGFASTAKSAEAKKGQVLGLTSNVLLQRRNLQKPKKVRFLA